MKQLGTLAGEWFCSPMSRPADDDLCSVEFHHVSVGDSFIDKSMVTSLIHDANLKKKQIRN